MQHHVQTVPESHRRLRSAAMMIIAAAAILGAARWVSAQPPAADDADRPYPRLVTAETLADLERLAALQAPGKVFFEDRFESADSLKNYFNARFEPWRDWGRLPAPGYMFLYTYWMDMRRDRDGNYWGNMLGPDPDDRIVLERDRWYCLEHMIRANDPGQANGELAAWIDGKLYIHYTGIRWRTTAEVKIKRFSLDVYIHRAEQNNTVWYDDVALSTGYIGPK